MAGGPSIPKSVTLILTRELASNVATPMLVFDAPGNLVFWNEPADIVLGVSFDQTGEMAPDAWDDKWAVTDVDGEPIRLLQSRLAQGIMEQTPGHQTLHVTGLDGVERTVEATAFPLFDNRNTFVGSLIVFWQTSNGHGPAGAAPKAGAS